MSFVKINNCKKSYGSKDNKIEVLKGIDLEINKGEICVLLGPSGSGKSTLLNILGGIEEMDEGSLTIGNENIDFNNEKELSIYRRKHLGYVFQMYNLIPNLTVYENIEVGKYLNHSDININELMKVLGIEGQKDKLPSTLSGGQQQRTSIARAIIKNPDVLLCDEPTGALDYQTSKEILKLLVDINQKYHNTIIIVTHNEAIKHIADHVLTLRDGVINKNYYNTEKINVEDLEW